MKKISLFCLIIILLVFSVTFARSEQSMTTLRIGSAQEPDTLHPLMFEAQASKYVINFVNRGLAVRSTEGQWLPALAESLPSLENKGAWISIQDKQKKLKAQWTIRSNARWGDGEPVTCADFKFASDLALDNTVGATNSFIYSIVEKIEWSESQPKKCTFTYKEVRTDFNELSGFYPLPKHLENEIYQKNKLKAKAYSQLSNYSTQPNLKGLYLGPYVVKEIKPGAHILLERNPLFYGDQPQIENVLIQISPNNAALVISLLAKNIDMIASVGLSLDHSLEFQDRISKENLPYVVVLTPSIAYEHLAVNLDNPILKSKKVRQALYYAIDRNTINSALYGGKMIQALHFIPPQEEWFPNNQKSLNDYKYNIRKSMQLLNEDGWVLNKNETYLKKDGKIFEIQVMTTSGNRGRENVLQLIQSMWQKIGVKVEIKNEPARVLFGETVAKRNFSGMVLMANSPLYDLVPFRSSEIPTEKNSWTGSNSSGWKNAKIDSISQKIGSELNRKKRQAYFNQAASLVNSELPVIPLFFRMNSSIISNRIKNFRVARGNDESFEAEYWKIQQ